MSDNINLSETIKYINKNIVTAQKGRKCVDGRYLPTQSNGMIARPGGDCGYVMALLAVSKQKALELTPEQCFNAIYKAIENQHSHFYMHTDRKTDPDNNTHKGLIGCGHLAMAATKNLCSKYDVTGQDIAKLVNYARNLSQINNHLEMINLEGEHMESGVLIINSKHYSINSEDPKLKKMYFIYDEERDNEFLKKLVEKMAIPEVTFADMKKESDLQLQTTLQILAGGLPIYSIKFKDQEPIVSFLSFVPKNEKKRYLNILPLPSNLLPRFKQKLGRLHH